MPLSPGPVPHTFQATGQAMQDAVTGIARRRPPKPGASHPLGRVTAATHAREVIILSCNLAQCMELHVFSTAMARALCDVPREFDKFTVSVHCHAIDGEMLDALTTAAKHLVDIRRINLYGRLVHRDLMPKLCDFIRASKRLEYLRVQFFGDATAGEIVSMAECLLRGEPLVGVRVVELVTAPGMLYTLRTPERERVIEFESCVDGQVGAVRSELLQRYTMVEMFHIERATLQHLDAVLAASPKYIRILHVSCGRMTSDQIDRLAELVRASETLDEIKWGVHHNVHGWPELWDRCIIDAIKESKSLRYVGATIPASDEHDVREMLKRNRHRSVPTFFQCMMLRRAPAK